MFTYDDFRATEGLRTEFGAFLRSDLGMIALRVLRERYRPYDVPNDAEALVSARILSQFHGAHTVLDDIEAMASAPIVGVPVEATFEAPETDHDNVPPPARVIPPPTSPPPEDF